MCSRAHQQWPWAAPLDSPVFRSYSVSMWLLLAVSANPVMFDVQNCRRCGWKALPRSSSLPSVADCSRDSSAGQLQGLTSPPRRANSFTYLQAGCYLTDWFMATSHSHRRLVRCITCVATFLTLQPHDTPMLLQIMNDTSFLQHQPTLCSMGSEYAVGITQVHRLHPPSHNFFRPALYQLQPCIAFAFTML